MIEAVGEQTSLWDRKRRAGQRLIVGFEGTSPSAEMRELIEEVVPAGFILFSRNIEDAHQVRELNRELHCLVPDNTPPILSIDQEGGRVQRIRETEWPPMRFLGNLDQTDRTRQVGKALGEEVRALGFNLDWAPVADVDSNPDNPVIGDRAFSRDPDKVARHVIAFLEGMQQAGCIGCLKHFPGHGETNQDSHLALPTVDKDPDDLEHCELVPFRRAIAAGAEVVMSAHVVFPAWDEEVPATMSERILRGVLRNDLGFSGLLVSDDLEMKAVAGRFDLSDLLDASTRATMDAFLCCRSLELQWEAFESLVRLQEQDWDHDRLAIDSVARLETLRRNRFASDGPPPDIAVVGGPAHRQLATLTHALGRG